MRKSMLCLLPVVCGLFGLLLLRQPLVQAAAFESLWLCAHTLLPALLPLSITANLFLRLGLHTPVAALCKQPLRRWLRLPSAAAGPILLGLLGGYPIGIHALCSLCRDGTVTRQQALRLSRFCNQAGPAFLVGAAGLALFDSVTIGLALWFTQLFSALCVALHHRGGVLPEDRFTQAPAQASLSSALPEAVKSSCSSLLTVCGFVVYFGVLLALLRSLPGLSQLTPLPAAVLAGCLELTNGLFSLSALSSFLRFVLAAAFCAWGGFCVQLQALTPLQELGLPGLPHLLGKLEQAVWTLPVSVCLAAQLALPGTPAFLPQAALLWLLPLGSLLFCLFLSKQWKKNHRSGIIGMFRASTAAGTRITDTYSARLSTPNRQRRTRHAVPQKRRKILRLLSARRQAG